MSDDPDFKYIIRIANSDVSGDWVLSTGSDYYAILDYGDTSYVSTGQINRSIRMTYDNFTDSFEYYQLW